MTIRYFLPLVILGVGGCAASSAKNPAADARSLAAAFVAGRAYDSAQNAFKRSDTPRLQRANEAYERAVARIPRGDILQGQVAPLLLVNQLSGVREALQLDEWAKTASLQRQPELRARALVKYRAAGEFLAANATMKYLDADTFNLVGYQLADRGTTRADWTRALQLTQLSLDEWDRQLKQLAPKDARRGGIEAARTVGPLDSHAWALFRLGRAGKAVKQQEQVLKFARANPTFLTAELPYHLAEIYRALGRDDDARREYEAALNLNPDQELSIVIDAALNGTVV